MRSKFKPFIAVSTLALLTPGAALADLSALDVWGSWKSYVETFGYEVEIGSESTEGDALVLRDLALNYPIEGVNMNFSLDLLEFRERPDGTVAVTMSPDMPMSISSTAPESPDTDIAMVLHQTGLSMIASGDPENITYDYLAQEMRLAFDKFFIEGEEVEPVLDMTMTGINGSASMAQGDPWQVDGRSSIERMDMTMAFEDPDTGDVVNFDWTMQDIASDSSAAMPAEIDLTDPSWVFSSGMRSTGSMSSGPMTMHMEATGEEGFTLDASSDSWTLDVDLSEGAISYGGSSKNTTYTVAAAAMPMPPITLSMGESAFALGMPMQPTEAPADFRFLMRIVNLTTDEFLWQMFDPAGMLPRDPASIGIDAEGKVRMLVNVFDPMAVEAFQGDPGNEVEIHELTINDLSLSIAGASIASQGAFTFDNSDLETFDGMPAPTGKINMDIYGLNGLLDTLMTMGLLPEDQAMGARMMLGLFARPGDQGGDHLVSEIDVNWGGAVLANGRRLRWSD